MRAHAAAAVASGIADPGEAAGLPCTQCKGGRIKTTRAHATCDNCDHCLSCEDGEGPHPEAAAATMPDDACAPQALPFAMGVGDPCPRFVCEDGVLGLVGAHLTCNGCGWCETCRDRFCQESCDWCGGDPPVRALDLGWPQAGVYCEDCEPMAKAAAEAVVENKGDPDAPFVSTYPDFLVLTDQDDRPIYIHTGEISMLTRQRAEGLTVVHLRGGGSDWYTVREAPLYILKLAGMTARASHVAHAPSQGPPATNTPASSLQGDA